MSSSAYYQDIRSALTRALCLHNFPSQQVERHNKPEVEVRGSPELLLPPVALARGDAERCLIEQSINSTRVRGVGWLHALACAGALGLQLAPPAIAHQSSCC